MDSKCIKALYRMGKMLLDMLLACMLSMLYYLGLAKRQLGNLADAQHYLMRAHRLSPGDTDIGSALADIDSYIKKQQDDHRSVCQRMFPGAKMQRQDVDLTEEVGDEARADIYEQLKGFSDCDDEKVMTLPGDLGEAELAVVRQVAQDLGLQVRQEKANSSRGGYWKILKEEK